MMNPIEAYYSRTADVHPDFVKANCTKKYVEKSDTLSPFGPAIYTDEHRDVYLKDCEEKHHAEYAKQQEALKAYRGRN